MTNFWLKAPAAILLAAGAAMSLSSCTSAGSPPAPQTTLNDDAIMTARLVELEALAEQLQIDDPPEVELVRFVDSNEWLATQVDCLHQAGYPVTTTEDGAGIDFSGIPAAQSQRGSPMYVAIYTCQAQYSSDPKDSQPLNDIQLSALYDYYTKSQVPCLEKQGITVASAPSRQTFIETYFGKTTPGWTPYSSIDLKTVTDEEWALLNRACPQSPELDVLYGN